MLEKPDKRLALQAYEQTLELILSGQAQPGDLINERQLCDVLDMSRTPVRDALLMLESEGLLVRQGKRGMQIRQLRVEDYLDTLQIRILLEPEMSRMAAGKISREELCALRGQFEGMIANSGAGEVDRELVRNVDDRLHSLIADAAGNQQLSDIVRTLRRQTQIFDLRSIPQRFIGTCEEHIAIIDALVAKHPVQAAEKMKDHLKAVRESILNRLSNL